MMAIINIFRYIGGAFLAVVLSLFLAGAAMIMFFIISTYVSGLTSYLTIITPIRMIVSGVEKALQQLGYSIRECWEVIVSCYKYFLSMSRFSFGAVAPFFRTLKAENG